MLYWLYAKHHIKPSDFYNMGNGEKTVMRAFFLQETEDIKQMQRN